MVGDGGVQQQNPDGSWGPAQPLGWQGGMDWEVRKLPNGKRRAELYDEDVLCAVVEGRGLLLALRMRRARRRVARGGDHA
jgi:hypothetical protein